MAKQVVQLTVISVMNFLSISDANLKLLMIGALMIAAVSVN